MSYETAWSARAIYKSADFRGDGRGNYGPIIDIDQQGFTGEDRSIKALEAWLNTRGLNALRARLKLDYLDVAARREVRVERGGYVIVANPNASYGYLYLGAWKLPLPADGFEPAPLVKITAVQRRVLESVEAYEGSPASTASRVTCTRGTAKRIVELGLAVGTYPKRVFTLTDAGRAVVRA